MDECSAIERLPDEILLMIFSDIRAHHLTNCVAKVCRRWEQLITHYILRIKYLGDEEKIHRGLLALLVTTYVPAFPLPSAILIHANSSMPNLQELTISIQYSLRVDDFHTLKKFRNLIHLDVFAEKYSLDSKTPIPPGITSLVVNNNLAPGFLQTLQRNRVYNAFYMYGRCVHYPPKELAKFLVQHSIHLTELTLRCSELTDVRYEALGKCTGLISLQLYSCLLLTIQSARQFSNLTRLRRLHVTGMRMIRVDPLFDFIIHLPLSIVELNLSRSWFGDEHIFTLVARLSKLRSLELWRSRITPVGLVNMAMQLTLLEDLDTDAVFTPENISTLNEHGSLKNARFIWTGLQVNPRFNIRSALDSIPVQYLREDGEGPQSELFYYWSQGISTRTPPTSPPVPIGHNRTEVFDWPFREGFLQTRN